MNILRFTSIFLTCIISSLSLTYPQELLTPASLQPSVPSSASSIPSLEVTLKCKIHVISQCDKYCNVCEAREVNLTSINSNLTEVTGFTVRSKDLHKTIIRLSINNQICHYLPRGTDRILSSVETLRVFASGLKKLDQVDIRGFAELRELILPLNDLEILDSNLFKFNAKIEKIDVSRNRIRNIGLALFSPIKKVLKVNLNGNECIDESLRQDVTAFIENVRTQCPPTVEMLNDDVVFLVDENEKLNLIVQAKDGFIKEYCQQNDYSLLSEHLGYLMSEEGNEGEE